MDKMMQYFRMPRRHILCKNAFWYGEWAVTARERVGDRKLAVTSVQFSVPRNLDMEMEIAVGRIFAEYEKRQLSSM